MLARVSQHTNKWCFVFLRPQPSLRILWILSTLYLKGTDSLGTSPVVQCLRLCASTAEGMGSIPGQGIKILMPRACMLNHFSRVLLSAALWTVTRQAPLSMGFSRQEYQSGLPRLPPGDLPDPGIEPMS